MEMTDLLPDSFELRRLEDGAPRGDVLVEWRWGPPGFGALLHALP